ncbi:hypothetical protein PBI_BIGNUZ_38 [Mycobacterium phage BigNuz]|uniref:Uncharacterized protein n=2 Tax=Bignuzvirus bignuz TaxID=1983736 RepID=G1JX53_9CAUD|nr:hypothetical protein PBI_BIGNUZ_38 [Mycobacterium phage BigNuz]AEL98201.1 hypothetical protein PBI_BIGNUZ_38 [Mycobacterium phage BigNuz]AOT24878.1 hypothetical protein PBI_NAZO_39 [Mycobacterium phage Nazo]
MSDEPYAIRVLQRVEGAAAALYAKADEDTRAALVNMAHLYHGVTEALAAMSRELVQYAKAVEIAEDARDEARAEVQALRAELDELRQGLAEGIAQAVAG